MSDKSAIEWTDSTWTPIRARGELGKWFCQRISPGCDHCYASTFNKRMGGQPYTEIDTERAKALVASGDIYLDYQALCKPLTWRKPRRIFLSSMTDIFGEWVRDEWLALIWAVMLLTPEHTYQVLTKRPARLRSFLARSDVYDLVLRAADHVIRPQFPKRIGVGISDPARFPSKNIWLGVSVESDAYTWRAKVLSEIPAAVRFISAEPLLGPVDLGRAFPCGYYCDPGGEHHDHPFWSRGSSTGIHWIITGGESGPGFRPADPNWFRSLRDQCELAGVAYFHKQNGGRTPKAGGHLLDGVEHREFPSVPVLAEVR